MADTIAQIENFKRRLEVVSDAEFASVIGYQRSTIAQWKKRGAIPAQAIFCIEQAIDFKSRNDSSRNKFSKLSASQRHFAKAVVIKYILDSTIPEDGDTEPDALLFLAMEMDYFELAGYRLLDQAMSRGAKDLLSAYRQVLATDLVLRFARELTIMGRERGEEASHGS